LISATSDGEDVAANAHIGFTGSNSPASKIPSGPEHSVSLNVGATCFWSIPRQINIPIGVDRNHQASWRV
jgi:hypothetical protein